MKIKKNLTLISLMLSVMMLVSLGMVSAGAIYDRPCNTPIDICTWTTNTGHLDYGLPLGSPDTGCGLSYNTFWALNTNAVATCTFNGDNLASVMLYLSIDNDIVSCTLNGQTYSNTREGCAPVDPRDSIKGLSTSMPVIAGTNTLVCTVKDRGVMSHFDACVIGQPKPCTLIIDNPLQGAWFNSEAVPIEWHLSAGCTPVNKFDIQYLNDGTCNPTGNWKWVVEGLASGDAADTVFPDYAHTWDRPNESGQYCLTIKVTSATATGYSGIFNVDLAPPEVSLSVGDNKYGECLESEIGDCYVNRQTPITLTCADGPEPWQSGVDKIEYRYSVNGGDFTGWTTYGNPFTFPQDSNHVLEYRCYDNVGKVDTESKDFIVDSVGPVFLEKTVGEPKVVDCGEHPSQYSCDYFMTKNTEICVLYEDPTPHPVNDIQVYCEATVWEFLESTPVQHVPITLNGNGCFTYNEDSFHELHCWAVDALGNRNELQDLYEADIVDTQAPVTTLSYTGPYYCEGVQNCVTSEVCWIDGISTVVLTPKEYPENHPVGLDKTYYRYGVVDDSYCYGIAVEPISLGEMQWIEYTEEFGIPEESCHVIEYYSTDLLGNTEVVKQEFVFVDKTAPETLKDVGKPSSKCGLLQNCNPIWNWYEHPELDIEWEVTLNTSITVSCVDQEPHPSGVGNTQDSGIYYRIVLDGKYNESIWEFVPNHEFTLKFPEESEHLLEFYCVDNVGKTSENHSELFKVTGTSFDLTIGDKWDLISVPFNLIGGGNIEDLFGDKVIEIWSYENGVWKVYSPEGPSTLHNIVPGRGYWVKTTDTSNVLIGGSLFAPGPSLPSSIKLDEGWNLIGHYGLSSKPAYCSLFSLVDTQQGFPRWSSLWSYTSASQQFSGLNSWDLMNPGRGYWLEMDVEDYYSPSSICWGWPIMPI